MTPGLYLLLLGFAAAIAFLLGLAVSLLHYLLPHPENYGFFGDDLDD